MVAERKECGGAELWMGRLPSIEACVAKCRGVASMFAFGTNDFGWNSCYNDECTCYCETSAKDDGTCNLISNSGYRLYKYHSEGYYYTLYN